ncbi:TetR/AcrR family transcriptional regulator [Gordonia sp. VNQ95]|uniref:TetR/AcrR family transcriptional regulator n=1 Tax=Gordonia sp. VNQ95 TaxID=3156619 RepID=UPI0032B44262
MTGLTPPRTRADRRSSIENGQAESITAAAIVEFRRSGVRRASIDRIAAEAGISRSTLYRRFPTKENLLAEVIQRLRRDYAREIDVAVGGRDPRTTVIETFVIGVTGFRSDDLIQKILADQPDALEMFVGFEAPQVEEMVESFSRGIAGTLRKAGASMPDTDLWQVAELVFRLITSFALTPTPALDTADADAVRAYARMFIAPLVW